MLFSYAVQRGDRISIPVFFVDATSRPNGRTGIAFGNLTVNYVKYGSQTASSNTRTAYTPVTADWFQVDSTNIPGLYNFQLPAAMVDTIGTLVIRFSAANADDFRALIRVVPWTQGNIRVAAAKANAAVSARNVAAGAISHIRIQVKSETASDWTTVLNTYYTRYSYFATSDVDFGAYAETVTTEPSETTWTYSTAA